MGYPVPVPEYPVPLGYPLPVPVGPMAPVELLIGNGGETDPVGGGNEPVPVPVPVPDTAGVCW
jgi:hypothetical protein